MRAHCLNGLGLVAIDAGRSDKAEELLNTSVAICEETRKRPGPRGLSPRRVVYLDRGDWARSGTCSPRISALPEPTTTIWTLGCHPTCGNRWWPPPAPEIRGAGSEYPAERPVLTVAQVFKLAELVGRRPVGNIRKLPRGGYQLRFQRDGVVRTAQEVCPTRAVTDRTLWEMAAGSEADSSHDSRYRALVLLAAFAILRWGEVTAFASLRRGSGR